MQSQHKPRVLWIAVKLFDKSVNKVTQREMVGNLAKDFDVHFLTGWRDRPVDFVIAGKPVQYFPQFGRGIVRKVSRRLLMPNAVRHEALRLAPDLVLLECLDHPRMVRSVCRCSLHHQCKAVLDVRTLPTCESDDPAWQRFGQCLSLASRRFSGITYITEEIRRYCIERYRLPEHRSAIWASGVNPDTFSLRDDAPNGGSFRLIYHGGILCVSRGLDRLIQAMNHVRDIDVRLTLISSLREQAVLKWIDCLGLRERVMLMDTIPHQEVPAQIHRHDAGILPFPHYDAWNTSSPIKLFEYMACGKPVIVTDIPAHQNVLAGKPFAFFASDASPAALAEAIRRAHAARGRFPELGRLARQQVLAQHTWAQQAEKLSTFLRQILES